MRERVVTPERLEELREFWATGQSVRVLAERWGCSTSYPFILARRYGLPHRHRIVKHITSKSDAVLYMETEAHKRGLDVRGLEYALLQQIAEDHLVDAILDDAEAAA